MYGRKNENHGRIDQASLGQTENSSHSLLSEFLRQQKEVLEQLSSTSQRQSRVETNPEDRHSHSQSHSRFTDHIKLPQITIPKLLANSKIG